MKKIAVYGFGGLGRELTTLIRNLNNKTPQWDFIGYFDDGYKPGTSNKYGHVLGGLAELNSWPEEISIVIAIADSKILKKLSGSIVNTKVSFPNIIAHDVLIFDTETINLGIGNIITYGCRLSSDVTMGNFNVLNGCVSLGHDVKIGDYNVMFPDVRISGETEIGNSNFFGARSFALQGIKIGDNVRVAAGSFVLRNTKDNYLYIGNPAKRTEIL